MFDKIFINICMWVFKVFQRLLHKVNLGKYKKLISDVNKSEFINIKVDEFPDSKIKLYYPNYEFESLPLILYIHGGGWSAGNIKEVEPFSKLLASNGYIVASIEYSLAPKYHYPVAINQVVQTINYLYTNKDRYEINNNFFIGGHSAGANLAAQAGLILFDKEYSKKVNIKCDIPKDVIKGLLLFSGGYNIHTAGDTKFFGIKKMLWSYIGMKNYLEFDRVDELTLINHINSFPNCFITVGNKDKLASQSYELSNKLESLNIKHTTLFWKDVNLSHQYVYKLNKKEGQKFYNELILFLKNNS